MAGASHTYNTDVGGHIHSSRAGQGRHVSHRACRPLSRPGHARLTTTTAALMHAGQQPLLGTNAAASVAALRGTIHPTTGCKAKLPVRLTLLSRGAIHCKERYTLTTAWCGGVHSLHLVADVRSTLSAVMRTCAKTSKVLVDAVKTAVTAAKLHMHKQAPWH